MSLNDIIRFIFVKDLQCVYCEAEYLNIIHIELCFKWLTRNIQALSFLQQPTFVFLLCCSRNTSKHSTVSYFDTVF